jgi:hypothetical protein
MKGCSEGVTEVESQDNIGTGTSVGIGLFFMIKFDNTTLKLFAIIAIIVI